MRLSHRKSGLDSLFKETRVFKTTPKMREFSDLHRCFPEGGGVIPTSVKGKDLKRERANTAMHMHQRKCCSSKLEPKDKDQPLIFLLGVEHFGQRFRDFFFRGVRKF